MIDLFGTIWRVEYTHRTLDAPAKGLLTYNGTLEQAYASLSLPDREGWTEVEDISDMKIHEVLELNSKLTDVYEVKIDMSRLNGRHLFLISA